MAKKSAKSKGYRKAAAKKPYLSKKEIIALCAILAVLVVGAILLFSYDDGALKLKDNMVQDTAENWLIVNGSSRGRRYFKLGEAGELEGYDMQSTPSAADPNLNSISYKPQAEDSPVQAIALNTTPAKAQRTAEYYRNLIDTLEPSEVRTASAGDTEYSYFTYKTAYHVDEPTAEAEEQPAEEAPAEAEAEAPAETEGEAPAEEGAETPNRFEQAIHAYIDAPHDSAIGVSVSVKADSEDDFITDEQLMEYAAQAIAAIQVEAK